MDTIWTQKNIAECKITVGLRRMNRDIENLKIVGQALLDKNFYF